MNARFSDTKTLGRIERPNPVSQGPRPADVEATTVAPLVEAMVEAAASVVELATEHLLLEVEEDKYSLITFVGQITPLSAHQVSTADLVPCSFHTTSDGRI